MNDVIRTSNENSTPYTRRELDETRAALLAERNTIETLAVDPDAERFRWLQEAVDRNDRFSVYEHGTKVFELRAAIDIVRGV